MSELINHVKKSLELTNEYKSKLNDELLKLKGMSGKKTRHFYNNICSLNGIKYLEIGCYTGSTACASMYKNNMEKCVFVDNWSLFGGPKDIFLKNFNKYKGNNNASFIEEDCFKLNTSNLGKFNVYMYDAKHDEIFQYMALNYYYKNLEDEFIYIVDDWNMEHVRNGTNKAIKKNNLEILYFQEYFTKAIKGNGTPFDWWNGIGIFVLKKK